ncbi:MAG: HlyD family secretion protein [Chitinophagales bacterium]|nr:HlyD family secretion protein [Chitinophagales bacterium]
MENQVPEKKKKSRIPFIVLGIVLIVAAYFGITKYIYAQHHETTDDAQIDGNISPVLPRIGGYVTWVLVADNQPVKEGDTLILLDTRDLQIKLVQAEAALANAQAAVGVSQAGVSTAAANFETAKSSINATRVRQWKTKADYDRYQNLLTSGSATQQQFDALKAEKETADEQYNVVVKQQVAARKQYDASFQQVTVAQSVVKQRQADVDFAKLQLTYAIITSPATGLVARKNVQVGQLIQPGQPLLSIVSDSSIWVTANFKETQVDEIQPGQKVKITADAFPGKEFMGQVNSFSGATGARFALLPPDNASGNFVKVVQRVPVKIEFTGKDKELNLLRPGMSVYVAISTSD